MALNCCMPRYSVRCAAPSDAGANVAGLLVVIGCVAHLAMLVARCSHWSAHAVCVYMCYCMNQALIDLHYCAIRNASSVALRLVSHVFKIKTPARVCNVRCGDQLQRY